MTQYPLLYESLEKRLKKEISLEEIGKELCSTVKDPTAKAIRLIKICKSKKNTEKFLVKNKDWLGYTIPHNPKGKNGKSDIEPKNSCSGSEDTGKEAFEIAKSLDKKFVVFIV